MYAQTSRGDNALHIAAKHGNAGCLHALLSARPQADGDGGTTLLGDVFVQGDTGPTKLIDLHNGGGSMLWDATAKKYSAYLHKEHASIFELVCSCLDQVLSWLLVAEH